MNKVKWKVKVEMESGNGTICNIDVFFVNNAKKEVGIPWV